MPSTSATRIQLSAPRSYVGWVSVNLNLTPRVFLRILRFSSLLKIDSLPIPSGCGAVLPGHTWVVFRGRAPSRQHSSFGPTSLSCALRNSVSDCEKGRLADQIFIIFCPDDIKLKFVRHWICPWSWVIYFKSYSQKVIAPITLQFGKRACFDFEANMFYNLKINVFCIFFQTSSKHEISKLEQELAKVHFLWILNRNSSDVWAWSTWFASAFHV